MTKSPFETNITIGATKELSLRLSVATLVRVLCEHPHSGEAMLALERRATLHTEQSRQVVPIKSQPFGGAIRIHDPKPLQNLIGSFHFDSEASRAAQDFRLFICPSDWETVWQFCLQHFEDPGDSVLESDPRRELAEEFLEALKYELSPEEFSVSLVGTILENRPSPTENVHAQGHPTVRIYRIFETHILDAALVKMLVMNSERYGDDDLRERAWEDARNGGKGWASAVLAVPLRQISAFYKATPPEARNLPLSFQGHLLDETVAALLEDVMVPKYQRLSL